MLPEKMSLSDFAEKSGFVDRIQPYQKRIIEIMEKMNSPEGVSFNREEIKNEFALLPHEYGTRFAPLRGQEVEFIPTPTKKEIVFGHYYHFLKDKHKNHTGCLDMDCPICEVRRTYMGSPDDFIKREEMEI